MRTYFPIVGAIVGITLLMGASMVSAQTPAPKSAGVTRAISAENNSHQSGEATLYPRGEKTLVVIRLQGEPAGSVEPAHIHPGHTCATMKPQPAFPLHSIVNGRSETLVAAPISQLLSGKYVINVHQSTANLQHYVACGALTRGA